MANKEVAKKEQALTLASGAEIAKVSTIDREKLAAYLAPNQAQNATVGTTLQLAAALSSIPKFAAIKVFALR